MRKLRVPVGVLGVIVAAAAYFQSLAAPKASPAQGGAEGAAIVHHLNAAITWYKQLMSANESAAEPSDAIYLENARSLAKQALQLAFQSASAEAALLRTEQGSAGAGADRGLSSQASAQQQNIARAAAATSSQISQAQTQIAALNSQIPKASGKKRQDLISRRDILQEQLDFDKTLQGAIEKLSTFMKGSAGKAGGWQEEIDQLKASVPALFAKTPAKEALPAAVTTPAGSSEGTGLVSQASLLLARLGDLRAISQLIEGAAAVSEDARRVQTPLRTKLRATIGQGRDLANQPVPSDPRGMEAARQTMASLTDQFKQISGATVPLAQEIFLLDESQASLREWEASVHRGTTRILESFLIRAALLLIGIGIVMGFSELWRKSTFRYVHDAQRRHQLLLLRHIVTGFLLAIVLVLGFVSEFSSLATFAGFLTAGIAVALQTVILSMAAYFFLIGRHGVKVGDRITVSGVTGDVVDVGLVRLSLMELGGTGSAQHPTGRVVVVSNSVLFQGTPFYKQIPGTAFAWHEVAVNLEPGSDYSRAQSKLLEAVNAVFSQYSRSIEEQHEAAKGWMTVTAAIPSPHARLQLVEKGLNLVLRFPVLLNRETEIDNEMAKKVAEVIQNDGELRAAVGSPNIRPATQA